MTFHNNNKHLIIAKKKRKPFLGISNSVQTVNKIQIKYNTSPNHISIDNSFIVFNSQKRTERNREREKNRYTMGKRENFSSKIGVV